MSAPPAKVLWVRGLRLSRGKAPEAREVLRGVDLFAERGELLVLMGLSGGGKTTVLRTVAALEPFQAGEVDLGDGVVLRPGPLPRESALRGVRRRVGLVFQLHCLFEHLSALDNVTLAPLHVRAQTRAEAETRARQLLESLGIAHRESALPRELSGGEAQRVAIARALAMDPPLLLMDEPTASLDPARRGELGATLRALTSEGRTLVVTTHDDDFARDFATRLVVMADGQVVEEGAPEQVLNAPRHPATRRLLHSRDSSGGVD